MERIEEVIAELTAKRNKHLEDIQFLALRQLTLGGTKITLTTAEAATLMKVSEKLLRTQISLEEAEHKYRAIHGILQTSFLGYSMPEKSETADAISLELLKNFTLSLSHEQPKESPQQQQEAPRDSCLAVGI